MITKKIGTPPGFYDSFLVSLCIHLTSVIPGTTPSTNWWWQFPNLLMFPSSSRTLFPISTLHVYLMFILPKAPQIWPIKTNAPSSPGKSQTRLSLDFPPYWMLSLSAPPFLSSLKTENLPRFCLLPLQQPVTMFYPFPQICAFISITTMTIQTTVVLTFKWEFPLWLSIVKNLT